MWNTLDHICNMVHSEVPSILSNAYVIESFSWILYNVFLLFIFEKNNLKKYVFPSDHSNIVLHSWFFLVVMWIFGLLLQSLSALKKVRIYIYELAVCDSWFSGKCGWYRHTWMWHKIIHLNGFIFVVM